MATDETLNDAWGALPEEVRYKLAVARCGTRKEDRNRAINDAVLGMAAALAAAEAPTVCGYFIDLAGGGIGYNCERTEPCDEYGEYGCPLRAATPADEAGEVQAALDHAVAVAAKGSPVHHLVAAIMRYGDKRARAASAVPVPVYNALRRMCADADYRSAPDSTARSDAQIVDAWLRATDAGEGVRDA